MRGIEFVGKRTAPIKTYIAQARTGERPEALRKRGALGFVDAGTIAHSA